MALDSYLDANYSNEYVLEQLRLDFDGDNRIKKSLRIVNKIVVRNPLEEFITTHKTELKSALKKKSDRNIILVALLNSAFPFSFDVLKTFGRYFAVQEIINSETIKKAISNVYGGNRATENGIYSVVPMFIEAGLFDRQQQGLYRFGEPLLVHHEITLRAYRESFNTNINNRLGYSEQSSDPYFVFLTPRN